MEAERERTLRLSRRPHLVASLRLLRRGAGDPTWRDDGPAAFWKAWRTPDGAATTRLAESAATGDVHAVAYGPGAAWLLDRLPALLGEGDDDAGFVAHHRPVHAARRRFAGWRVPATGLAVESLVPAILEQKVTGMQAFASYRMLVRRYGEAAPGPEPALRVAPDVAGWLAIPSWAWLQAGVDAQRADTIMRALRSAGRIEALAALAPAVARARLQTVPGIGVWTAAEVAHRAWGDADAVSYGDYHVARNIGWALTGVEVDDAGLAALLEPYAGHAYRVQRLLELSGTQRPRRGARLTVPTHLPTRWR